MQKKKNISSIKPRDIVIGIFCLSGMGISLFFFWKDLNISLAKKNEQPIAIIYFKRNTAQRRLLSHNLWERLQQSSKIYDGDRIRTAEYSEAYTVFNDGNTIDLHENTLVQVFKSDKGNNVSFIEGAVSISAPAKSEALTVTSGSKVIKIDANSDVTLAHKTDSQIAASVQKGSILIADKKQEQAKKQHTLIKSLTQPESEQLNNIQKLETGSAVVFANTDNPSENKNLEKSQLSELTVFMPTSTSSLSYEPGKTPTIPVKIASQKDVKIEFSRDSSFTQLVADCTLPVNSNVKYISLPFAKQEDTIFWRIIPADKNSITGKIPSGIIFIHEPESKSLTEIAAPAFGEKQAEKISLLLQSSNNLPQILNALVSIDSNSSNESAKTSLSTQAQPAVSRPANTTSEQIPSDTTVAKIIESEPKSAEVQSEQTDTQKVSEEKKAAELAAAKKAVADKKAAQIAAARKAAELAAKKAAADKKTAQIAATKKAVEKKKAVELAAAKKAAADKKAADIATAQKADDEKKSSAALVPAATSAVATGAAAGALSATVAPTAGAVVDAAGTVEAAQASAAIVKNAGTDTPTSPATASSKQVVSEIIPLIADKTPLLDFPQNGTVLGDQDFSGTIPKLPFSWQEINDAQTYTFTIYKGSAEGKKLLSKTTDKKSYTLSGKELSLLGNGTYYWTVTASAKANNQTYTSKTGSSSFMIKLSELDEVEIDTSNLLGAQ
jgi:hypothetical protein